MNNRLFAVVKVFYHSWWLIKQATTQYIVFFSPSITLTLVFITSKVNIARIFTQINTCKYNTRTPMYTANKWDYIMETLHLHIINGLGTWPHPDAPTFELQTIFHEQRNIYIYLVTGEKPSRQKVRLVYVLDQGLFTGGLFSQNHIFMWHNFHV